MKFVVKEIDSMDKYDGVKIDAAVELFQQSRNKQKRSANSFDVVTPNSEAILSDKVNFRPTMQINKCNYFIIGYNHYLIIF